MIDHGAIEAVSKTFDLGLPSHTKAVLLIELDGNNAEVLLEAKLIKELINNKFLPIQYKETQDPQEKKFLWKVRKGTVAAFGQLAPFWYLYDAVVPRSKIPEALSGIERISEKYKLKLASVLHAADGNLHPNFLYDPDKDPTVIERIHQASHEVMKLCIALGGVLSGEHGIGIEKREYMPFMFSDADMETMLKVRQIFDPKMISNPQKIFPIRICKEC
jgi:glycolate oxidase